MKYKKVIEAEFLERPNRFIAYANVLGERVVAHVKNTGRCRELLVPGCKVYLSVSDNPERKTAYDLVTVEKLLSDGERILVNMDSQAPNELVAEWLSNSGMFSLSAVIKREVRFGESRFDFAVYEEDKVSYLEVKGVTLECDGTVKFPDAPTERGVKHIKELSKAVSDGYGAYIVFVVQLKGAKVFVPNSETDPDFASALAEAKSSGVIIKAVECDVTPSTASIIGEVPLGI